MTFVPEVLTCTCGNQDSWKIYDKQIVCRRCGIIIEISTGLMFSVERANEHIRKANQPIQIDPEYDSKSK